MIELRRLLCPVDFSEDSQRALRYALTIAVGTSRRSRSYTSKTCCLAPLAPR